MTAIVIPNTFLPSTTISSTAMNANFQEVVDGLAVSLALDGSDTMTGSLRLANGTAALPALTFGSDPNLGIYRRGTDELGFSTAGVLRGYFDAAGKLWALGAADITGALDVGGALVVDGASTFTGLGTFSAGITLAGGALTGFPTASEGAAGFLEIATDAEIRSAAAGALAVTAAKIESASALVALVDAAPVAVDWDAGIAFSLTVTANRQIGNPTNGQPGTFRVITVQGNSATDRVITFGNQFLGDVPVITDCDSGRWYDIYIRCITATHFSASAKRVLG